MIQHLRTLKKLKIALYFSLTVQFFLVALGIYFLIAYVMTDQELLYSIENAELKSQQIKNLEEIAEQTIYPESPNNKNIKDFYFALGRLNHQVQTIDDPKLTKLYQAFADNPQKFKSLQIPSELLSQAPQRNVQEIYQRSLAKQKSLIAIGILSLFFGFIIPAAIFGLAIRLLRTLQKNIQKEASQFSAQWISELERFEGEAFKNINFWLNIILMTTARASHLSTHPGYQLVGDVAQQIKEELEKQRNEKDTSRNENIHSL